jgi:hypothetical protein
LVFNELRAGGGRKLVTHSFLVTYERLRKKTKKPRLAATSPPRIVGDFHAFTSPVDFKCVLVESHDFSWFGYWLAELLIKRLIASRHFCLVFSPVIFLAAAKTELLE